MDGSEKSRLVTTDVQNNDRLSFRLHVATDCPLINGFVDDGVPIACPSVNEALFHVAGVTDCMVSCTPTYIPASVPTSPVDRFSFALCGCIDLCVFAAAS